MRSAPLALLLVAVACASATRSRRDIATPTPKELAAANIGDEPDYADAKEAAEYAIRRLLRDPESARFDYGTFQRGWYVAWESRDELKLAWQLPIEVNAKNGFGGYSGAKNYAVFFLGSEIVALSLPQTDHRWPANPHEVRDVLEVGDGGLTPQQAGLRLHSGWER